MGINDNNVGVTITGKNQAQETFDQVSHGFDQMRSAADMFTRVMETVGVIAITNQLRELASQAIETDVSIARMAEKVGISVESISQLKYAASLSGLGLDELGTGLKKFDQAIVNAGQGTPKFVQAFEALGIKVKDANGNLKPTEQLLMEVANAFHGAEDGATKTAIAVELFGRSGMTMIPMLNQGAAGVQALMQRADQLGGTLSGEAAEAAETFHRTLTDLQTIAMGLTNQFLSGLKPAIDDVSDSMRKADVSGDSWAKRLGNKLATLALLPKDIEGGLLRFDISGLEKALGSGMTYADSGPNSRDGMMQRLEEDKKELAELQASYYKLQNGVAGDDSFAAVMMSSHDRGGLVSSHGGAAAAKKTLSLPGAEDAAGIDQAQASLAKFLSAYDALNKTADSLAAKGEDPLTRQIKEINDTIAKLQSESIPNLTGKGGQVTDLTINQEINALISKRNELLEKQKLEQEGISRELATQHDGMDAVLKQIAGSPNLIPVGPGSAGYAGDLTKIASDQAYANQQMQQMWDATRSEAEKYRMELERITALQKAGMDDDTANRMRRQLQQENDPMAQAMRGIEQGAQRGLGKGVGAMLNDIELHSKGAKAAFHDLASSMLQDINNMIGKMLVQYALAKALGFVGGMVGGGGGAGGGLDFGMAGSGSMGAGDSMTGMSFFAQGGHMDAGQVGIVGDGGDGSGAEVWAPDTAGTVIPMDKARGAFGQGAHVTNNYDFRGADPGSEQRILGQIRQMGLAAKNAAVLEIQERHYRTLG